MWALGSGLGAYKGGLGQQTPHITQRSPLSHPTPLPSFLPLHPTLHPFRLLSSTSYGRLLTIPGLLRQSVRLISRQPGVWPRCGARWLRGGRARQGPRSPSPAGTLSPVGLQGLQAQVQLCGPETGCHHARAPAAEEGQPRFRGSEALHLGQPQPTSAQGGDPAQRHPVHRELAGTATRAGGKLLRPPRREQLGAWEPSVQLL